MLFSCTPSFVKAQCKQFIKKHSRVIFHVNQRVTFFLTFIAELLRGEDAVHLGLGQAQALHA